MTVKARIVVPLFALVMLIFIAAPANAADTNAGVRPEATPAPHAPEMRSTTTAGALAPVTTSPIPLAAQPVGPQSPPDITVLPPERERLEHSALSTGVVLHQWSPTEEVPPESVISERYIRTRDQSARSMTLKEAIYLALRNNPNIQAASLTPLGSLESVRQSEAIFDPDLTSKIDELKSVTPTTSILQTGGAPAFAFKQYDWDFAVNKLLSSTNGTMGLTFNNTRLLSNSAFASINPSYNPSLALSLSQPLLRNFGLDFATINLRITESNQEASQFSYEQQLSDFILQVASDYWNVVRAEENLGVAREAYKLAADLVRQNQISVRVGVLAPLDLQESQSEEATTAANVYQADDTLTVARATLRQDVMLNPSRLFLPQQIQPSDRPSGPGDIKSDEEQSLELAMEYRPELAAMRQMIRSLLLQVKFAENQTLPQLSLGAQIGLTATAGSVRTVRFSPTSPALPRLPFGGIYGDALNDMWGFGFYNYAAVLSFERPLTNDAAKAALAQARIQYEQQRLQYRGLISHIVVDVESQLSAVNTGIKRVNATRIASDYSREALRAEQERFRVGMANTHEVLQFQEELVAALGAQVNAEVDLELAKLSLRHAEGTLLRNFNVRFEPEDPHQGRWYAQF
jgi:outer membrane protein